MSFWIWFSMTPSGLIGPRECFTTVHKKPISISIRSYILKYPLVSNPTFLTSILSTLIKPTLLEPGLEKLIHGLIELVQLLHVNEVSGLGKYFDPAVRNMFSHSPGIVRWNELIVLTGQEQGGGLDFSQPV
jgi:hypothetical protein